MKKYYCIDCKKEVSDYRIKRCRKCNGIWLYKNGKLKVGKYDLDYKNGISIKKSHCIDCKKILSDYRVIRCKSCATINAFKISLLDNKGKKHYNWKGGLPHCIDCNKKLSNYKNKRCYSCENKRKHKEGIINCKGKNNHFFGKHRKPNFMQYCGVMMRSSWEVNYARYLDKKGIKWLYESKTFNLGKTTYTPDFYLPKKDSYIEIKGWWDNKAREKFKLFKKLNPKIKCKLYRQNHLRRMGIIQ